MSTNLALKPEEAAAFVNMCDVSGGVCGDVALLTMRGEVKGPSVYWWVRDHGISIYAETHEAVETYDDLAAFKAAYQCNSQPGFSDLLLAFRTALDVAQREFTDRLSALPGQITLNQDAAAP